MRYHQLFLTIVSLWLLLGTAPLRAVELQTETPKAQASLLAEFDSIKPGTTSYLGLHLKMQPEWHTYWRNPGDSGLPTKLKWHSIPKGVELDAMQWPAPSHFIVDDQVNFGYEKETVLLIPITLTADYQGSTLAIQATASWLSCREACIREQQPVAVELAVKASPTDRKQNPLITKAVQQLPQPLPWPTRIHYQNQTFTLMLETPQQHAANITHILAASNTESLLKPAAPQPPVFNDNSLNLTLAASPYLAGVPSQMSGLVILYFRESEAKAYRFDEISVTEIP